MKKNLLTLLLGLGCLTSYANWIPSEKMVEPNWLALNNGTVDAAFVDKLFAAPKVPSPGTDGEVYTPLFSKFKTYEEWRKQFLPGGVYQGNATQSEFYLMSNRILAGFYKGNFGVMDSKDKINAVLANLKEEPAGYTFEEGELMIAVWDSYHQQMLLKPYRGKRTFGKTYGLYDEYGLYYPVVVADYNDQYGPCFNLVAENINTVIQLPGETKIVYRDSIVYITKEVPCLEDGDDCDCDEEEQVIVNNYYNQDCGCYQAPVIYSGASAGIWVQFDLFAPAPPIVLPPIQETVTDYVTYYDYVSVYDSTHITVIDSVTVITDTTVTIYDTVPVYDTIPIEDTIDIPNGTGEDTIDIPNGDSSIVIVEDTLDVPDGVEGGKMMNTDSLKQDDYSPATDESTEEMVEKEVAALLDKKSKSLGGHSSGQSTLSGSGINKGDGVIPKPAGENTETPDGGPKVVKVDKKVEDESGTLDNPISSEGTGGSIKVITYYAPSAENLSEGSVETTNNGVSNIGTVENKPVKDLVAGNNTNPVNNSGAATGAGVIDVRPDISTEINGNMNSDRPDNVTNNQETYTTLPDPRITTGKNGVSDQTASSSQTTIDPRGQYVQKQDSKSGTDGRTSEFVDPRTGVKTNSALQNQQSDRSGGSENKNFTFDSKSGDGRSNNNSSSSNSSSNASQSKGGQGRGYNQQSAGNAQQPALLMQKGPVSKKRKG